MHAGHTFASPASPSSSASVVSIVKGVGNRDAKREGDVMDADASERFARSKEGGTRVMEGLRVTSGEWYRTR